MTLVPIRVLIINKQLGFSVRIKQALEQVGRFEVSPFTTADAGIEQLRKQPYHVAIVDFTFPGIDGNEMVNVIRKIQPDIAIIASPDIPEVRTMVRNLDLSEVVDVPCSARELIPAIERAVSGSRDDALPDTTEAPPIEQEFETIEIKQPDAPDFSSLDSVIVRMGGLDYTVGTETLDVDMTDAGYDDGGESNTIEFVLKGDLTSLKEEFDKPPRRPMDKDANEAVELFQKLASEEPPFPSLEDSGTVSDLMKSVSGSNLYRVVESIMEDHTNPSEPFPPLDEDPEPEEGSTAAMLLLQSASTQSDEEAKPSLDELLKTIEKQHSEDTSGRPRPPWVKDVERYIREPDFLGDALPELDDSIGSATTNTVHIDALKSQLEAHDSEELSPPPSTLPEMPVPVTADQEFDDTTGEFDAEEQDALVADLNKLSHAADDHDSDEPEEADDDEEQVAQLALSLTQASLESTAEGVLLAQGKEVISYSGDLPLEDMAKLHETIAGDWDAEPGEARIRFTTLPDSGQDYMLYSRKTEDDYTLSMIFEGTLPLRIIRQQSEKILEALHMVPHDDDEATSESLEMIDELYALEEAAAAEEAEAMESTQELLLEQQTRNGGDEGVIAEIDAPRVVTPEKAAQMSAYTYLWILRDSDRALSRESAQAVVVRLHDWLMSIGWDVQILQVFEDYVYLMVGVPDDEAAQEIIEDLKSFSAQIVGQIDVVDDPDALWADSYCFLTPGRELTQEEIQRFINFERTR